MSFMAGVLALVAAGIAVGIGETRVKIKWLRRDIDELLEQVKGVQ